VTLNSIEKQQTLEEDASIMTNSLEQQKKATGERIKAARLHLSLNLSQLARLTGVSSQAVQQWEEGVFQPRGNNLRKVSEALHMQPQYIQFGDNNSQTPVDVDALLKTSAFKLAFHRAFQTMMAQASDMDWINCPDAQHIAPLADITLANLRQTLREADDKN
jgi:DNA-binding transcriptional regulator YiaG